MGTATVLLWKHRIFYLFVLPFAALTIVFGLWPIAMSVQVSFTDSFTALSPDPTYIGIANYLTVFADPQFQWSMAITLIYTVLSVAANVGLALLLALVLHNPMVRRGSTLFKLCIFLPVVTPDVAGYIVWKWMYNQNFGAINALLGWFGLPAFGGIADSATALWAILLAELWHHVGFYTVIFLTNLQIVDTELEDAARIDGARPWQRVWYVVLPQLRPAIMINTVYALIQFLKTFTVIVVMTRGGPNFATNMVSYYAYLKFDQAQYGEATAMATTLFVAVIGLAWLMYWLNARTDWR